MKRPADAQHRSWDDPFWHALRLLVDQRNFTTVEEREVLPRLRRMGTDAATGLADWLEQSEPSLITDLAGYTHTRYALAEHALEDLLRTEDEAVVDFGTLSSEDIRRYTTQTTYNHQSAKVMVQTVEVLTKRASEGQPEEPDVDPQKRAASINGSDLWVSPRRLDGALPSLLNPVGLWEIKEYWGSGGGSKMSDAVYEIQLVGTELAIYEREAGVKIKHYAILDGRNQWGTRKADMRRMFDLLYSGVIDELIIGREVLTEWERIVSEMWSDFHARQTV